MTDKAFRDLFEDAATVKDGRFFVSAKEVEHLEAQILARYRASYFFKCQCGSTLDKATDVCPTAACSKDLHKRTSPSELKRFSSFSVIDQIESTVAEYLEELIEHRTLLHNNLLVYQDGYLYSTAYRESIESAADFANGRIDLVLTLNTDGFHYNSATYTGDMWPVVMAILDLPASVRYYTKNLVTGAVLRSRWHPTVADLNDVLQRLEAQCAANSSFQVTRQLNNRVYTVFWKVGCVSADNQALQELYDHKTYNGGGCLYCQPNVVYSAHGYRYELKSGPLKDAAYIALHAPNATGDFGSETSACRLCSQEKAAVDLMHAQEEGLGKELISDLTRGRRFEGYYVDRHTSDEFDACISKFRAPTYWCGRYKPLSKLSDSCAKDLRMHHWVTLPLACCLGLVHSSIPAMFALVISSVWRYLLNDNLSEADLTCVGDGYEAIGVIWNDIFGEDTTTYKVHLLCAHVPEQLAFYNNLVELDCSGFEHNNLLWKQPISPLNTRSFDGQIEKGTLLRHRITEEILERGEDTTIDGLRNIWKKMEHNRARGMRNYEEVSPEIRVPVKELEVLAPNDARHVYFNAWRAQQPAAAVQPVLFYSRISWKGQIVAAHSFWPMPAKSRNDQVVFRRNNRRYYGSVRLIARSGSDCFIVLELHDTADVSEDLKNDVTRAALRQGNPAHLLTLLSLYSKFITEQEYTRRLVLPGSLLPPFPAPARAGYVPVFRIFNVNEMIAVGCIAEFFTQYYFITLPSRKQCV